MRKQAHHPDAEQLQTFTHNLYYIDYTVIPQKLGQPTDTQQSTSRLSLNRTTINIVEEG